MTLQHATTALLLAFVGAVGCLPADTRPEPGRVNVSVNLPPDLRASQSLEQSLAFTTGDDWSIALGRLYVSMGNLGFASNGCNEYAEARYGRVIDMLQPGPQKLGQIWGLNDCLVSYSVYRASEEAVLGNEVTASDRAWMRDAIVPVSSPNGVTTAEGMTLHVQGTAEKDGTVLSFDWGFADRINWTDCKRRIGGSLEAPLPLVGGETIEIEIELDPRNLFQLPGDAAASSLLPMIADADQRSGNANGRVSIEELYGVAGPADPAGLNLAEFMRLKAYPSLFEYAGDGSCERASTANRHGGPGGGGM